MRTPPDLHPDDLATRECLRDMLVDARRAYGLSQATLGAQLGKSPSTIFRMETDLHWRISTVQRWASAVRLRLVLSPACFDINEDVYLLRPSDHDGGLAFDRRVFIEALRDARKARRFTCRRLGERLGISDNGVMEIEKGHDILLANAQRYCRGINSWLSINLEEMEGCRWQA